MEIKQPEMSNYFDLPNPGLWAYFQHTVDGSDVDIRPPFWKGKNRSTVLDDWLAVIEKLGVKEKFPTLYDYEMEMKDKVGPMSIQAPLTARMKDIESYYTRAIDKNGIMPISQEAIDATIDFFGKVKGMRLRSRQRTVEKMRLNTNAGSPTFTRRRRVVKEILKGAYYTEGGKCYCTYKGRTYELVAILGWRGQEGGISIDDVKQRVIWMMPFLLNIEELRFYQPFVEAVQKHKLIPAYVSMDEVDKEVTLLFDTKGADDVVICTDFTKFDQSIGPKLQSVAKTVISKLLTNNSESSWWLENVFPVKYNIPLVCSRDIMFTGSHGMGSGSGGTNADECIEHKSLQFQACLDAHTTLNPHSMAYGDDGVLSAPGLSVDQVIETYTRHGMEMNPSKQYVSKHDCVVLRRWHSTNYRVDGIMVGVYSTFRALGRLLAQERFYDPDVWGPEMVTLRAWSIIENCNHSPYFEEFVNFILAGDRYRLGLDIPGFMERINQISEEAIDQLPDFLGYTKTLQNGPETTPVKGIKDWRIYQYLKSLKK